MKQHAASDILPSKERRLDPDGSNVSRLKRLTALVRVASVGTIVGTLGFLNAGFVFKNSHCFSSLDAYD